MLLVQGQLKAQGSYIEEHLKCRVLLKSVSYSSIRVEFVFCAGLEVEPMMTGLIHYCPPTITRRFVRKEFS